MNMPKDYAPPLNYYNAEMARLARQDKIKTLVNNGLMFMAGFCFGLITGGLTFYWLYG